MAEYKGRYFIWQLSLVTSRRDSTARVGVSTIQDGQCTYNVTFKCVRVIIFTVEKQYYILWAYAREGGLLNMKCEFRLPLQFLPETFFILRRNERVIVTNPYYYLFTWSTRHFCQILMIPEFSRHVFGKKTSNFVNIGLVTAVLFHVDRQTWRFPKNDTMPTNYVMISSIVSDGSTTTKPFVESDKKNKTKLNKIKSFPQISTNFHNNGSYYKQQNITETRSN
jgi:hypothetical protein